MRLPRPEMFHWISWMAITASFQLRWFSILFCRPFSSAVLKRRRGRGLARGLVQQYASSLRAASIGRSIDASTARLQASMDFAGESRDAVGERFHVRADLVRVERLVDRAVRLGLVRVEVLRAQDDLEGASQADLTSHSRSTRRHREGCPCDFHLHELRLAAGREAHVTGERELVTAARARTPRSWRSLPGAAG